MTSLEHEFTAIRSQFPMLQRLINGHPFVYLDSAATAQKPFCVIDAITNFYKNEYGTVHRAVYTTAALAGETYQNTRKKIATFLNVESEDEIIFTRGTTSAINIVAHSFGQAFVKPGDEIIITEMEHHSNIVPWQIMAENRGAKLQVVPFSDKGELDMDVLKRLLSDRTKIVAVAHISNTLGTINPIQDIAKLAHQAGAKLFVDGAQSAPHMLIDVQKLDCDFFAFSGHKIVGPTGVGILYGKKELLEQMPPFEGGGDMIDTVTFAKTTYNVPPLKFEAGTPMIAEVIGLGAAIDFVSSIGMEKIQRWEHELLEYCLPKIKAIPGLKILGLAQEKASIITFAVEGVHPLDIATLLDLRGIAIRTGHLCAQPVMRHFGITAAARASFCFYNTKQDIDQFIDALSEVIAQLK